MLRYAMLRYAKCDAMRYHECLVAGCDGLARSSLIVRVLAGWLARRPAGSQAGWLAGRLAVLRD